MDIKIDVNDLLKEAKEQIANLALATASKYKDQVILEGNKLLVSMQKDLIRWTEMLAEGKLTTAEFETLAKSYKVELTVSALQQAGLASVRSYDMAMGILNVIIDVALKMVDRVIKTL